MSNPEDPPPPHNCVKRKPFMAQVPVPASEYHAAARDYQGWCLMCEDFTRDATEPDAEGYFCPECRRHEVVGAELALLRGDIKPVDDLE